MRVATKCSVLRIPTNIYCILKKSANIDYNFVNIANNAFLSANIRTIYPLVPLTQYNVPSVTMKSEKI